MKELIVKLGRWAQSVPAQITLTVLEWVVIAGVVTCLVFGTRGARAAPECAKPGGDCIEFMQQQGPAAFCDWASAFAALGAHKREQNDSSKVALVFSRELTAREKATIDYWLQWGWDSKQYPPMARQLAFAACMSPPVKL